MDFEERMRQIADLVKSSRTKEQFDSRKEAYDRILQYAKQYEGDDFILKLWTDYKAWCAYFLTTEANVPFIPTPWQEELQRLIENYDDVWAQLPRRNGKTAGTAAAILYHTLTHKNVHVLFLAPTAEQLVLMEELRTYLSMPSAELIFREYIGDTAQGSKKQNGDDKKGSKFNTEQIRFLNGSRIEAKNLNINASGNTKRGVSADILVIDEFSIVPPKILNSVVGPITMDSFTANAKKVIRIGTPDASIDPELPRKWAEALEDPEVGTLTTNTWEAIAAGIRQPKSIKKRFRDLSIPCPFVGKCGICPTYLPDMYEKATGERVEQEHCPCGSENNSDYMQEDMALFATKSHIGLNDEWVIRSGLNYHLEMPELLDGRKKYVMSADWGDVHAETWIGVWEIVEYTVDGISQPSLKLVYKEIIVDDKRPGSLNPSAARMKYLYHTIKPIKVIVDVTGKKDQINHMLNGDDRIPLKAFMSNKAAENNGTVGIWASGPLKAEIMNWMVECYRLGRIHVPNTDVTFWQKYKMELSALQPEPATTERRYVKWPDTLHMTDSIALAAWMLNDLQVARYAYSGFVTGESIESMVDMDDELSGFYFANT